MRSGRQRRMLDCARVTNLTIAEGAFAHTGEQLFTLIDAEPGGLSQTSAKISSRIFMWAIMPECLSCRRLARSSMELSTASVSA